MLIKIRGRGAPKGWRNFRADYPPDVERPKTRGDCVNGVRPCPFASCRHHIFLSVTNDGNLKTLADEIEDMPETCALDVADDGPHSLQDVAATLKIVRERVRQIETEALKKLLKGAAKNEVATKDFETRAREHDPWERAISAKLDSWDSPLPK